MNLEDWCSEVSGEEMPVFEDPVPDMVDVRVTPAIRVALEWLDTVNLCDEFTRRAAVMKSVPHFLRGPHRNAMRLAMRKQHMLSQTGQNVGGDYSCCSRTPVAQAPPREATSTRTSWSKDLTISQLENGCSFCMQAGSAMRKLLWPAQAAEEGHSIE